MSDRTPLIRTTAMPADTNPYGGVFGGWLMSQMALAAGSLASRTARGKCVVVAASDLAFPGAPSVGDEISVYAHVERVGRTSMGVRIEVLAERDLGTTGVKVTEGLFTFVALDENNRPRPIAVKEETNG